MWNVSPKKTPRKKKGAGLTNPPSQPTPTALWDVSFASKPAPDECITDHPPDFPADDFKPAPIPASPGTPMDAWFLATDPGVTPPKFASPIPSLNCSPPMLPGEIATMKLHDEADAVHTGSSEASWVNPDGPQLAENRIDRTFCAVQGCALPIDCRLESSDGDSIPFHRSLLAHFGTNVTVEPVKGGVDSVDLTAKGEIINLLVQFMHPHRFPSCAAIDFDVILSLAHVAEKYQVYPAMQMCNFRLSRFYKAHPAHVLFYAFHHGYPELADTVAPFAL
ncbi:hypothetical protein C8J56DRAFT_832825, partial [Mycena floridula]